MLVEMRNSGQAVLDAERMVAQLGLRGAAEVFVKAKEELKADELDEDEEDE